MSKRKAQLNLWLKEIAPSDELRQWFSHESEKWQEFQERYRKELLSKKGLIDQLKQLERGKGAVTLVYSAKDTERNNARVLKTILDEQA
jgi:uncharacterized protein YeaO (DUF488 family)